MNDGQFPTTRDGAPALRSADTSPTSLGTTREAQPLSTTRVAAPIVTTRYAPSPAAEAHLPRRDSASVGRARTTGHGSLPAGCVIPIAGTDYTVQGFINASGEGEVFKVSTGSATYALKVYHYGMEPVESVLNRWAALECRGLLKLYYHGKLPQVSDRYFELMEFAAGGSLREALPIRDLGILRRVVADVTHALDQLHHCGIVHRDVKPDNLLFLDSSRDKVVITDLGVAKGLDSGRGAQLTRTLVGTRDYLAPEGASGTIIGEQLTSFVAPSLDYYALGITLIELWSGSSPFAGWSEGDAGIARLYQRVPIPPDLPEEWQLLVAALLAAAPSERLDHDGVERWLRGDELVVPRALDEIKYPRLSFRTTAGRDVTIHDPTAFADILESEPVVGETFLYERYYEKAGWDKANPGLCSQLFDIVRDYSRDRQAGVRRAIFTLDPKRPFVAFDGSRLVNLPKIAKHMEEHIARYESELTNPNASLWLWLEARNYGAAFRSTRDAMRNFVTDPKRLRREAWHMVLRMEPAAAFQGSGIVVETPTELFNLPRAERLQVVTMLVDPSSKLSVWVEAASPDTIALSTWRGLTRRDDGSLRFALNAGVLVGDEEVGDADEVLENQGLLRALEDEQAAPTRAELAYWCAHYGALPLSAAAASWLKAGAPGGPVLWPLRAAFDDLANAEADVLTLCSAAFAAFEPRVAEGAAGDAWIAALIELAAEPLRNWLHYISAAHPAFADRWAALASAAAAGSAAAPRAWASVIGSMDSEWREGAITGLRAVHSGPRVVQADLQKRAAAAATLRTVVPLLPYLIRIADEDARYDDGARKIQSFIAGEREKAVDDANRRREDELDAARVASTVSLKKNALKWRHLLFWTFASLVAVGWTLDLHGKPFWGSLFSSETVVICIITGFAVKNTGKKEQGEFLHGCMLGPVVAAVGWVASQYYVGPVVAATIPFFVAAKLWLDVRERDRAVAAVQLPSNRVAIYESGIRQLTLAYDAQLEARLSDWRLELAVAKDLTEMGGPDLTVHATGNATALEAPRPVSGSDSRAGPATSDRSRRIARYAAVLATTAVLVGGSYMLMHRSETISTQNVVSGNSGYAVSYRVVRQVSLFYMSVAASADRPYAEGALGAVSGVTLHVLREFKEPDVQLGAVVAFAEHVFESGLRRYDPRPAIQAIEGTPGNESDPRAIRVRIALMTKLLARLPASSQETGEWKRRLETARAAEKTATSSIRGSLWSEESSRRLSAALNAVEEDGVRARTARVNAAIKMGRTRQPEIEARMREGLSNAVQAGREVLKQPTAPQDGQP